MKMTRSERAVQFWPLLVFAARMQQFLSYRMLEEMTGIVARGAHHGLGPIQKWCDHMNYPALQAIVINEALGKPGPGCLVSSGDLHCEQLRVFVFDWAHKPVPTRENFEHVDQTSKEEETE